MKHNKTFSNVLFIFLQVFKAAPFFVILAIIDAVRAEWCNYFEHTYGIYYILESIEFHRSLGDVMKFLLLLTLIVLLSGVYSCIFEDNFKVRYMPRIKQRVKEMIYEKAKSIDLEYYDDPEYYSNFVLAIKEINNSVDRLFNLIKIFFGGITIIICYGSFFIRKDMVSIVFAIVSFLLSSIFRKKLNKIYYDIRIESNPAEKKRNYIQRLMYLNRYAKELRLNKQIYRSLYNDFDAENDKMVSICRKYEKKRYLYEMLGGFISTDFIINIVYVIFLVYKAAVLKLISYSSVVVMYNSVNNLQRGMSTSKEFYVNSIELSLYVKKIRGFLNLENHVRDTGNALVSKKQDDIIFENVSFKYNATDKYTLKDLNMQIKSNQKVAIVGANGAGKSTLIKLLLRLYDVNSGQIKYGNKNIKDYKLSDYRKSVGIVYQDFNLYACSVAENVVMDDVTYDDEQVWKAIDKSGVYDLISEYPNKLQTQITTEFDEKGVEL